MAKTLLNGVNAVLKRVSSINSDLSSLTDTGIQRDIDICIDIWNEVTQELYSFGTVNGVTESFPSERKEFEIVLVDGTREYAYDSTTASATDVSRVLWPALDKSNGHYLWYVPYDILRLTQNMPKSQPTGLPTRAAINPANAKIYMNTIPDAAVAGRTYVFEYERVFDLSGATDEFPFSDAVFNALVPVVAGAFRMERSGKPLNILFPTHFARAARLLRQTLPVQQMS